MALVSYSDSEGSDLEDTPAVPLASKAPPTQPSKLAPAAQSTYFAVDKSNPKKIRVNLTQSLPPPTSPNGHDGEPPAKRPRVGAGAFAGFNAMLPPPKRDNMSNQPTSTNGTGNKAPARKVFSLKTGAEPAFSRDADDELRELLTDEGGRRADDSGIPSSVPQPTLIEEKKSVPASGLAARGGKPFMFKPLSVARNTKKKKTPSATGTPASSTTQTSTSTMDPISHPSVPQTPPDDKEESVAPPPPRKEKISLFSSGPSTLPLSLDEPPADGLEENNEDEDEIIELLDQDFTPSSPPAPTSSNRPETLDSIASSLNLSAAERRQLLGRSKNATSTFASASRVINFNTDAEYIANQELNAAGEQVQHNPVRAIAPGKHSLKSLVASAQGQKDALEESFASGRKNKREAGSKYGW